MAETDDTESNQSGRDQAPWNHQEAKALRGLAESAPPLSPALRGRVVERLVEARLISATPSWTASRWLPWAAAAALAIVGFAAGRKVATPAPQSPQGATYVLLLTGGVSITPEENASRRQEYGDWMRDLQRRGITADGAELVTPRHELPAPGRNEPVVGYFIITAKDESEALDIARANPHLKHGGGVTLAGLR